MAVAELGRTGDNLKMALQNLTGQTVPPGGWEVLDRLRERARREGIYDLEPVARPPLPGEGPPREPNDEANVGIVVLLAASSFIVLALGIWAAVAGVMKAVHG
jgi:hypothetical protein